MEIWESKKGLSLKAITFEINLYNKLHSDIGLKSAKVKGLSFLGINERKVEFREGGIYPETLERATTDSNSSPNKSKKCK